LASFVTSVALVGGLVTSGIEAVVSSLRRGSQVEAVTLPEFGVMGGANWLTERL